MKQTATVGNSSPPNKQPLPVREEPRGWLGSKCHVGPEARPAWCRCRARRPGCEGRNCDSGPPAPRPTSRGTGLRGPRWAAGATGTVLTMKARVSLWARSSEVKTGTSSGRIQGAIEQLPWPSRPLEGACVQRCKNRVRSPVLNHLPPQSAVSEFTPKVTSLRAAETAVHRARADPHPALPGRPQ